MRSASRRDMLKAGSAVGLVTAAAMAGAHAGERTPQPHRPGFGGTNPAPHNVMLDRQNPDLLAPPATDEGTLPNLRFPFSDAHTKLATGGWTRQVTVRELPIATNVAGVNMRLNAGGVRELHWHKAAEWAYMLYGKARITAIDSQGRNFVDDVGVGDLWYFASGIPHSIQGLDSDGCEFLLVFDDGSFDENNTFGISDWFKHVPNEVLAKNFGAPAASFADTPDPSELYIFPAPVPGPLGTDKIAGATVVPQSFSHRMMAQEPIRTKGGTVRITDSSVFPVSTTIASALSSSSLAPCGSCTGTRTRTNGNIISRVRAAWACSPLRATQAPSTTKPAMSAMCLFAMGHYIENTGSTPLRFLEIFKSSYYADLSLNQWMALTPPELMTAHLNLDRQAMQSLRIEKAPVVPA